MALTTIDLTLRDGHTAWMTLTRPEQHNAMSLQLIRDLRRAVADVDGNPAVRVVVLAGRGESFCAGGDLKWMRSLLGQDRRQRIAESEELARLLYALNTLSKPVIARVHGPAYGGGVGLIACCDVAVGASAAQFALTEVTLGLVPANIAPFVTRRLGEPQARRLMLSGRRFGAAEARELGLLHRVVDGSDLDRAVQEEIAHFLRCAPGAVARTKRLITYVDRHDDADNLAYTSTALADAWEAQEGQEGIHAFLQRKRPGWREPKS